jgi:uncharacterized membrane protein YjfL (UPF0719 family)
VVKDSDAQPVPAARHLRKWTVTRLVIALLGAAYIGYLALLVTCDLRRGASLSFVPVFEAGVVTVAQLEPDSIGAHAGLREGDRLRRANGQVLEGPTDWLRVRAHLDPSKPFDLEIERTGRSVAVSFPLSSGLSEWQSGPARPALLAFRLAQVITLGLAIVVAFKRDSQPSALLGAVLLASVATVSVALPMRLGAFWKALPALPGALLWIPFATSVAVGPLLFAFFAVFPRRVWSLANLGVTLVPGGLLVGWHVFAWHRIMQSPGLPTGLPDWIGAVFGINVIYAAFAVALLLAHKRTAETRTDERRIGVLIAGVAIGVAAGAAVVVGHWRNPGVDIFASRTLTGLSLVFLAVPASFAYAILRHRLFDISLIVRQGLRYALARGFVDGLIPTLGALLLFDVIVHREQSLLTVFRSHWWWFTGVGVALLVVRARREDWLNLVDRRFFRERYDAQRLLRSIAEEVRRASNFEAIAPSIVHRIDEALHPEFVSVLGHVPGELNFAATPGSSAVGSTEERTPMSLPTSLAVIGVLSVLRKPLALSLGDTAWVRHQLPIDERALLINQGIELLVPISSQLSGDLPLGLLVLGPRRSEEPYNQEDLDLLVTIAHAVGLLLERSAGDGHTLAECETCGQCFDSGTAVCPDDHQRLTMVRGSRLLNGRYRLVRRLGRGGMGAVYAAVDDILERPVAVKLIREDVVGPLNLSGRFLQEARLAAGLAHPHVVSVYDFGVDRHQRPFLVMELLEGNTLRQRLASGGPLSRPETLDVLRGVCSALSAAHDKGLVHRDLKPENIFLQRHPDGVVPKVLDFGLAKAFNARLTLERATGSSAGLLVGTLDYMAPEQVAGDDVDPGWDLWAMGVITYEMLTATHPFRHKVEFRPDESTSGLSLLNRLESPQLTESAARFFGAALSVERALRPGEALGFLEACEQALL